MRVVNAVTPTPEQIQALAGSDQTGPVIMLNLLKFRERAAYDDGDRGLSGREAYMLYAAEVQKLVASQGGGRLLTSAAAHGLVIGEVETMWDAIATVEYATPQAFVAMAMSPAMGEIAHHRKAGLEGQLLIMCTPMPPI